MTAWLGPAVLGVCLASTARMPEVYAKDPKPAAKKPRPPPKPRKDNCVKLVEARVDDVSFEIKLDNTCKVTRECTIKWSVACEGSTPTAHEESGWISAGEDQTWPVSAAHCGDAAFVISPPRFACKPPAMDSATR